MILDLVVSISGAPEWPQLFSTFVFEYLRLERIKHFYPFIPILKHWKTFILSFNSNKTFVLTFATETLSRSWSPTTASLFAFRLTPWWFNINVPSPGRCLCPDGGCCQLFEQIGHSPHSPRVRSHPGPGPLAPASPSEILDLGLQQTLSEILFISNIFVHTTLCVLLSLDKYACI